VLDREGGSTWCHRCGALAIEREGYRIGVFAVTSDGCCEACGARIPGVFGERPGTWGRLQPVRLGTSSLTPAPCRRRPR